MISPTGKPIRGTDKWGSGHFLAPRGVTVSGEKKFHQGADFECEPNGSVLMPLAARFIREARPYPKEHYSGIMIETNIYFGMMFYLSPNLDLIGYNLPEGFLIGTAQDISARHLPEKYPAMTPHVHLELWLKENLALVRRAKTSYYWGDPWRVYIDPAALLGR